MMSAVTVNCFGGASNPSSLKAVTTFVDQVPMMQPDGDVIKMNTTFYYPSSTEAEGVPNTVLVVLQGAAVLRSQYSGVLSRVARWCI